MFLPKCQFDWPQGKKRLDGIDREFEEDYGVSRRRPMEPRGGRLAGIAKPMRRGTRQPPASTAARGGDAARRHVERSRPAARAAAPGAAATATRLGSRKALPCAFSTFLTQK